MVLELQIVLLKTIKISKKTIWLTAIFATG